MALPNERLAVSLVRLEELQRSGRSVFRSAELSRVHRERLIANGFLQTVTKGWLMASGPDADRGETACWFSSFWEFCAAYCGTRFGNAWHLSPEQSLLLHADSTSIPLQIVVCASDGTNNRLELPLGMSLYDLRTRYMPPSADCCERNGLRFLKLEPALIRVTDAFFAHSPVEARIVLASVPGSEDILRRLLDGGHSAVAGRLAGAFCRIGRTEMAAEILGGMRGAGYDVRETDPFTPGQSLAGPTSVVPPIATRLHLLWESLRGSVITAFPHAPGRPRDTNAYLALIDSLARDDAYHSLSIEGYRVTPQLNERVGSGDWDPERHGADRQSRGALAARGYWQAFRLVRNTVGEVIAGANASRSLRLAHQDWVRELFQPSVTAGLIPASALAGYRNHAVFLRGSRHVPPRWEAVRDAMPVLFDLLKAEDEPAVRAVLGHWLLGYIHPHSDGNGRLARFAMNLMLASGGYPWTVIRVEDRHRYLAALEEASANRNIEPFARFVGDRVRHAMNERESR